MINNNNVFNPNFRSGEVITADKLNNIKRETLRSIRAGKNIKINNHGDNIEITTKFSGGGAGGMNIELVERLPEIPDGPTMVYWLGPENGGTGNESLWFASFGYEKWVPMNKFKGELMGNPGE